MRKQSILFFLLLNTSLLFNAQANNEVAINIEDKDINNVQLVNRYFDYFNNHEWEKMSNMYVNLAEFKDPSLGHGIFKQSHKQILIKYQQLNELFSDIHDKIIKVYPSGKDHVIVEFTSSGTAPNGSKFELAICTIFTFKEGLIIKDFSYFDDF